MKRKFGGRGNRFWRMGRRERRNVECSPSLWDARRVMPQEQFRKEVGRRAWTQPYPSIALP